MRRWLAAWGVAAALAAGAWAAEAPEFTPKVTDVTVFKDGHALVMARGSVELKEGWCRTREVPAPVLGTFWAFAGDADARVDFVKAGFVEASESLPCLSLEQMIQANKGKKATVVEQGKEGGGGIADGDYGPAKPATQSLHCRRRSCYAVSSSTLHRLSLIHGAG